MRYPVGRVERLVGVFLLLGAGAFALLLAFQAREGGWLRGKNIRLHLEEGHGITPGTVVKVNGLKAGSVRSVSLVEEGHVEVVMRITPDFVAWVRSDSRVRIIPAFVIGSTEIDITPGSPNSPPLRNDAMLVQVDVGADALAGVREDLTRAMESVEQTLGDARKVMADARGMIHDLRSGEGRLGELVQSAQATMRNLEPATERAAGIAESTAKVLKNLEPASEHAARIAESTETVMKNFEPTSANLAKTSDKVLGLLDAVEQEVKRMAGEQGKVEALTAELQRALEHLRSILQKLDRGEGTAGKLINDDTLYKRAVETVDEAHDLVEGIRKTEVYVDIESDWYDRRDLLISTVGLRIVPRPSRYFYLGGAVFTSFDTSPVVVSTSQDFSIKPEFFIAQKLFDDRVTARGGLLEGKLGGGVDWDLPDDFCRLFVEGRGVWDSPTTVNEAVDSAVLLRAGVSYPVTGWLRLNVTADNLTDQPGLGVGLAVEWLDKDITKVVGLMGAAK